MKSQRDKSSLESHLGSQYASREEYLMRIMENPSKVGQPAHFVRNVIERGYPTKAEDKIISKALNIPSFYETIYSTKQKNSGLQVSDTFFNYALRNARIFAGYSLKGLAQITGIHYATLAKYERIRAMPNREKARKIVNALNLKLRKTNRKGKQIDKGLSDILEERTSGRPKDRILTMGGIFPKKYYQICEEIRKIREEEREYSMHLNLGLLLLYSPGRMDNFEDSNVGIDKLIGDLELTKEIKQALEEMGDMEKKVLILRYGFNGYFLTMHEVAKRLRLSPIRVMSIEQRALVRFGRIANRMGLILK